MKPATQIYLAKVRAMLALERVYWQADVRRGTIPPAFLTTREIRAMNGLPPRRPQ